MKLRNRKNREIGNLMSTNYNEVVLKILDENGICLAKYGSLAELNEGWEDYEEPKDKDFWFFDEEGIIRNTKEENWPEESVAAAKAIGNYFETKEEAELAVRKLKAWKRLKDKGLKLELRSGIARGEIRYYLVEESDETEKDLRTCFGGEE